MSPADPELPLLSERPELIAALPEPSRERPWRLLLSGCIAGWSCGVDGSSYGLESGAPDWLGSECLRLCPFCPEDVGLGTPRHMPDLHGGDGLDVLDGRAQIRDERGRDLTAGMLAGARAMARFAAEQQVDLALLTDASAACGSVVITLGCRFDEPRKLRRGLGVATALLLRQGVPVVSPRDRRTLARLGARIDGRAVPDQLRDHRDSPWVRRHLSTPGAIARAPAVSPPPGWMSED